MKMLPYFFFKDLLLYAVDRARPNGPRDDRDDGGGCFWEDEEHFLKAWGRKPYYAYHGRIVSEVVAASIGGDQLVGRRDLLAHCRRQLLC